MTLKTTKTFDLNLFSGSSELLRQTAGGYYYLGSGGEIIFEEPNSSITAIVESAESSEASTDSDSLAKKISYATRLAILNENEFVSDGEWKTYLLGGTFGSKTYSGLYNESVYADHYYDAALPYKPRELVNTSRSPSLTLTTEYFNRYPLYQTTVNNLTSELQAQNLYLLDQDVLAYDNTVNSSIGTGSYSNLKPYFEVTYPNNFGPPDQTLKNLFILNNNVLQHEVLPRKDKEEIIGTSKFDGDLEKLYSLMPFGVKINLAQNLVENSQGETYRDLIEGNEYQGKLLKLLKETFQGEIPLTPATIDFGLYTESEISNGNYEKEVLETQTISARVVDAPTMFLYGYRNYLSETNDAVILSSSTDNFDLLNGMLFDLTGTYRYRYHTNNINMFTSIVEEMNTKFENSIENINKIDKFLKQANIPKYHETLAYRVQKIGGQPTGDANTQNTVQNIWFYNSGDAIDYLDTQVKYDTEYTYKMYKYDIVQGYKYQLSDIIATRKIADTSVEGIDVNCLEFYNLTTGEATSQLLETDMLTTLKNLRNDFEEQVSAQEEASGGTVEEIASLEAERARLLADISVLEIELLAIQSGPVTSTAVRAGAAASQAILDLKTQADVYVNDTSFKDLIDDRRDKELNGTLASDETFDYMGRRLAVTTGTNLMSLFPNILGEDTSTRMYNSTYPYLKIEEEIDGITWFRYFHGEGLVNSALYGALTETQINAVRGVPRLVSSWSSPDRIPPIVTGFDPGAVGRNVASATTNWDSFESFITAEYASQNFDYLMWYPTVIVRANEARVAAQDAAMAEIESSIEEQIAAIVEQLSVLAARILALGFSITNIAEIISAFLSRIDGLTAFIEGNPLFTNAQVNSEFSYLADFNINIEPSLKIIEVPLEEKNIRIVDHPPNDFVITPHHLLDQSNRLAFYCKYDTFSMEAATYPPALTAIDTRNKSAYLTGNDFIDSSTQTQESVSRPRFLQVYRTTTKPTSYLDFDDSLRKTIDLRQTNGDIVTDHLFIERVKENVIYYYAFRSLNENGVAGQMSPVIEAELINDGGYVYGRFQQHSEEDLAVEEPKEPLMQIKKLFNIIPNIQHLQLNTDDVDFTETASSQINNITLGSSDVIDPLFTDDKRHFKIRLTSKKTGRKIDINVGFKKEVRK